MLKEKVYNMECEKIIDILNLKKASQQYSGSIELYVQVQNISAYRLERILLSYRGLNAYGDAIDDSFSFYENIASGQKVWIRDISIETDIDVPVEVEFFKIKYWYSDNECFEYQFSPTIKLPIDKKIKKQSTEEDPVNKQDKYDLMRDRFIDMGAMELIPSNKEVDECIREYKIKNSLNKNVKLFDYKNSSIDDNFFDFALGYLMALYMSNNDESFESDYESGNNFYDEEFREEECDKDEYGEDFSDEDGEIDDADESYDEDNDTDYENDSFDSDDDDDFGERSEDRDSDDYDFDRDNFEYDRGIFDFDSDGREDW